jgi:hypothetical protein
MLSELELPEGLISHDDLISELVDRSVTGTAAQSTLKYLARQGIIRIRQDGWIEYPPKSAG